MLAITISISRNILQKAKVPGSNFWCYIQHNLRNFGRTKSLHKACPTHPLNEIHNAFIYLFFHSLLIEYICCSKLRGGHENTIVSVLKTLLDWPVHRQL